MQSLLAFGALLISCHQKAFSSDLVESPAGGACPSTADFILASCLSIPFLISLPVSEIAASSSSRSSLFCFGILLINYWKQQQQRYWSFILLPKDEGITTTSKATLNKCCSAFSSITQTSVFGSKWIFT